MNHQEAKELLSEILPEDSLTLIKVEVFRLSWQGKGYNIVAEELGYDHDYVRKAGSQLWQELATTLNTSVTKRNFRLLIEEQLSQKSKALTQIPDYPGSAISFSSPFYIERNIEETKAYSELKQPGCLLRIKSPRKMGKSSLVLRLKDQADVEGFNIINIDFMQTDRSIISNLDTLLKWLCYQVTMQLGLECKQSEYWNPIVGSKLSCTNYLKDYVLPNCSAPIVLFINELNILFDFEDISKDFLPLLRSWHEEAKHDANMQKIKQVLVYSTEVYVQLDINLSPFNVGLPIELSPFTGEQLSALAKVYGFNWKHDEMANSPITQLLNKLGGHPYLCQLAFYQLATEQGFIESPSQALKDLLKTASQPGELFNEFFQQSISDLQSNDKAISAFNKFIDSSDKPLTRIEMYLLERSGVIRIVNGEAKPLSSLLIQFIKNNR